MLRVPRSCVQTPVWALFGGCSGGVSPLNQGLQGPGKPLGACQKMHSLNMEAKLDTRAWETLGVTDTSLSTSVGSVPRGGVLSCPIWDGVYDS